MRINCTLRNHLRQAWMDLPEQPVQGRSDRWLHAPDLHGKQWRPVLRGHRRRLRQLARLRHHLPEDRLDLPEQSVQGRSDRWLHASHLQPSDRRPVLRNHRRRLRQLGQLRHGLLGRWQRLGVRQQQLLRGRAWLPASYLQQRQRRAAVLRQRGRRLWRDAGLPGDMRE
jgi:hypothetical protein